MNKKYYLFGLLSALIIPVLFFIHIVKADGEYIAFIKDTNRDEGTITVDITLPFFLNFIGNGDQYANGDDLSKISYNGANPISAIRINNQLITATFDIDQMGTGKTGGDFVMASGLFGTDGLGTPNNEIIIDDNYIVDEAVPTFYSVEIHSDNDDTSRALTGNVVTVAFIMTEPITSPTVTMNFGGTPILGDITVENDSGNQWTARYMVDELDAHGEVTFSISDYYDMADMENEGATITSTTNATTVTVGDEIFITNCAQLQSIGGNPSGNYVLANNIDCSMTSISDTDDPDYDADLYNNGEGFIPIGSPGIPFEGLVEGNGHTISNLYINRSGYHIGLFGYLSETAEIQNVNLENVSITGSAVVGGLAGLNRGHIFYSSVQGEITGSQDVGGLVGKNGDDAEDAIGFISNSYVKEALVAGTTSVGGLVGSNPGNIEKSYVKYAGVTGHMYVGGLVGWSNSLTDISESYADVFVQGITEVGGFIGLNAGEITNAHTRAMVEGTEGAIGGFAGVNSGTISFAYAVSQVEGIGTTSLFYNVGGFVGDNYSGYGVINSSFSAGEVEVTDSYAQTGTFIGYNGNVITDSYYWQADDVGQGFQPGLTGEASRTAFINPENDIFSEWDFDNVWAIDETGEGQLLNAGLPYLVERTETYSEEDPLEDTDGGEPIVITSCMELQLIVTGLQGNYLLGNDIDCSMTNPTNDNFFEEMWGEPGSFVPIGNESDPFTGTFDGQGYVISNLYVTAEAGTLGLFGFVEDAEISNVGLVNPIIYGGEVAGSLVGSIEESVLQQVYSVGGRVNGNGICVGGLVGISYGMVMNSYARTKVNGSNIAGGLVSCNAGLIVNSYSSGKVSAEMSGGLVGDACCDAVAQYSFWDMESSRQETSYLGTGKSSAAMKDIDTYTTDLGEASWHFAEEDGVWAINAEKNNGYPYLQWQTSWATTTDEEMIIETGEATDITETSAVLHGHLAIPGITLEELMGGLSFSAMIYGTTDGSAFPGELGDLDIEEFSLQLTALYPEFKEPDMNDDANIGDLFGEGVPFQSSISNLTCGTTYYYRAMALFSPDGIPNSYNFIFDLGEQQSFSTLPCEVAPTPSENTTKRSRGGGSSIARRIQNILSTATSQVTPAITNDWSQLYPANTSVPNVPVRNLEFGISGVDVKMLQELLNNAGFQIALTGPGSRGNETMFFGAMTRSALARYQASKGIVPSAGYFGPITRAQMKTSGLSGLWW